MKGGVMTSGHDRTETLVFAGIALGAAVALYAMSVTSERGSDDAYVTRSADSDGDTNPAGAE